MNYKNYLAGKKITCLGLGLLGRGVGDALFLAQAGAEVTVTDLKSAEALKTSVQKLKKYLSSQPQPGKIRLVLGRHDLSDFVGRDFILKSAGVLLDSPYIAEARKKQYPDRNE